MKFFKLTALAALIAPVLAFSTPVVGATFSGVVYDKLINNSLVDAETFLANTTDTPVGTFESTIVPTFSGSNPTRLSTILAAFATTSSVTKATKTLQNTLFLITGYVSLSDAAHTFNVTANDGFKLSIGGNVVLSRDTQGGGNVTKNVGGGVQEFRLVYFNNANAGNFGLTVDAGALAAVDAPKVVVPDTPAVPLPAGLPLVLSALGGFAVLRRRRAKA